MKFNKKIFIAIATVLLNTAAINPVFAQDFSGNSSSPKDTSQKSITMLKKLFADAKTGDWIETESKKKYRVKTVVVSKTKEELILETQNIIKGVLQSTACQKIDLVNDYISELIITDKDGKINNIPTHNLLLNQINVSKYEKVEENVKVKVPAGRFICDKYKAIADDKVVYFWLSDDVPVNKIVKAKIKHAVIKLTNYSKN